MTERRIPIDRVVDLTDPARNTIFNMSVDEAREVVRSGTSAEVESIDGSFALVAVDGVTIRLARSLDRPLRYFVAKLEDGPCLVVSDRVDAIHRFLRVQGLGDQFHPYYTRMVPAHYVTQLQLVGCPDPNPTYQRFFHPERGTGHADIERLGEAYIRATYREIRKWLQHRADDGPIGVSFSGGIDSGAVFLLTHHALLELGIEPYRLKAFTLSVGEDGEDLARARRFLEACDMVLFHEPVEVRREDLCWEDAVRLTEDYKPLDIEAATMSLALCRGIRRRYPAWRMLLDGDGGDENLKDYPIEDNPELTIRSVLNNSMLYQEGWGVHAIKHSLTYSGGLSRSYTRTYAPASSEGFDGFSPFTQPEVIRIAESIPFIELTAWQHDELYALKGRLVSAGVRAVTGVEMPVFDKCRFQHGVAPAPELDGVFPDDPLAYRRAYHALYAT